MATIVDKRARWNAFLKAMSAIPGEAAAYVGITGDTAQKDHTDGEGKDIGITNAELGAIHEFGLGDAVERPFIRPATEKGTPKYLRLGQKLSEKMIDGKATMDQTLNIIGAAAAADVQNYIASNQVKPPSKKIEKQSNAKRKGRVPKDQTSKVTLVDHGILKASITWRVGYGAAADEAPAAAPPTAYNVFDLMKDIESG